MVSQVLPPSPLGQDDQPTAEVANLPTAPDSGAEPAAPPAPNAAPTGDPKDVPDPVASLDPPQVDDAAPAAQAVEPPQAVAPEPQVAEAVAPETPAAATMAEPAGADAAAVPPMPAQEAPVPPPSLAPETELADSVQPDADAGGVPALVSDVPQASPPAPPSGPAAELAPAMAELPPPPPLTPVEEALLQPSAEASPAATSPTPTTPIAPTESRVPPAPGLSDTAEGVITGRLPRIGDAPQTQPDPVAEADPAYDPAQDESLPPLQRYARAFDNPDQKPLFAILLQDTGADVNRAELAAMDLPLTVVIDPLAEGAADRAAIWRAAGQEVVLSAEGLPEGATPGDLEQIFQALASRLPQSVAVIDGTGSDFQNNRIVAAQIVPILAEQGRAW